LKQNTQSKLTKKFIITIAAVYSILILITSFSFNFIIKKNYLILKDSLLQNNRDVFLDKASIIIERTRSAGAANIPAVARLIGKYCGEENDILYAILYSKTSDENFFRVIEKIQINANLNIDLEKDSPVREEKDTHYLKKALAGGIMEPEIYTQNNLYWQNTYCPYPFGNNKLIIQFMISSSHTYRTIELYSGSINKIRLILIVATAVLICAVITATAIFSQNFSLLITNLSRYIRGAADGNLELNLKTTDDRELSELALSFNSLMDEIRDIKSRDAQEQNPYKDLFNTGVSLLKENRNDEAIALFRTLIIMKMGGYGCYFNLGVAFARIRDFRVSLEMFEKAYEANPSFDVTLRYIEKIRNRIQEDESARP